MEFAHRGGGHPSQNTNPVGGMPAASGGSSHSKRLPVGNISKIMRIISVVLLFSLTILVLAIASLIYFGGGNEAQFINKDKYQAVDLNVGGQSSSDQIYFGHITALNDKYLVLKNIYYIVPSSSGSGSSSSSYTLVKLGCELHAPYDQMIVNRDHVVFWENLQSSGTVAQKIAEYVQQNPNGPNCSSQNSNASSSSSSSATSTQSSTGANTTPSSTSSTPPSSSSTSNSSTKKP